MLLRISGKDNTGLIGVISINLKSFEVSQENDRSTQKGATVLSHYEVENFAKVEL